MGSLESRVGKLERATGGGSDRCERCGGTVVAYVGGKVDSVTRHGQKFPHAAAIEFVLEEGPQRRCPLCGTFRQTIGHVGGPVPPR